MAMKQNKVEFEITLKKHAIIIGDSEEEVVKTVQKQADAMYYNSADSLTVKVTKVEPIE